MANSRYRRLYESFVFGQRICSISLEAEAIFWRIYVIADDYGNFEIEPKTLVAKAGGLRKLKQVDIQAWIKEMETAGLIKLYQAGEKSYGHFLSFSEMQVPSGPAQSPDFGMQRYCPESPWDKSPIAQDAAAYRGTDAHVPFQDVKEGGTKKNIIFNTNTNTKTNTLKQEPNNINNNTSSRARENGQLSRLFKDPEFFGEEAEVADPKLHDFVSEVMKYWQKKMNRQNSKLTPVRLYRIKQRFKDSTLEEVKQAIDGCTKSDYHMGRQPNNPTKYDDIELICRYRHKLEQFMDKVTFNPKQDSWEEKKRRSDDAKAKWHGKK